LDLKPLVLITRVSSLGGRGGTAIMNECIRGKEKKRKGQKRVKKEKKNVP
jgi:hypothetical protein